MNYPPCLICSSLIINPNIKVDQDGDDEDEDQSLITFLLTRLLEIPQNEVLQHQEKLINCRLNTNTSYCESCKKLIFSSKQIHTEILELCRKFRKIQKQIVQPISTCGDDDPHLDASLTTSNHHQLLDWCRSFIKKHDFNRFGFPFVVDQIPEIKVVKEEVLSEDDDPDYINYETVFHDDGDYQPEEDNLQNSSSSANEDNQNESDSDFEPSPFPKKASKKKTPIKKPSPSSPKKKRNRKSTLSSASASEPSRKKSKSERPRKVSRLELLYPNYPPRLQDPITKKFHCSETFCSKIYPRKPELERHIIIEHLQDNYYKCEEANCGKSYAQQEHFKDHVSWHAGVPRWKCQENVTTSEGGTMQCTEAFFARKKLNRHVQMVHQTDKAFICEICGNKFSCQDYLTTHKYAKHRDNPKESIPDGQVVNEGEGESGAAKNLICNYCGKSFNVQATLNVHINLVHEQTVGKFGCQFCECKFIAKICLKKHLWGRHRFSLDGYQPSKPKNKVEEQPYRCEVKGCKVGFQKESSLKKHMEERHGGGKEESYFEFSCKYCGKGFHLRRTLGNHEGVHENKESKPFSCEICGKGFAIMRYLNMHKRNTHKIGGAGAEKKKELKN